MRIELSERVRKTQSLGHFHGQMTWEVALGHSMISIRHWAARPSGLTVGWLSHSEVFSWQPLLLSAIFKSRSGTNPTLRKTVKNPGPQPWADRFKMVKPFSPYPTWAEDFLKLVRWHVTSGTAGPNPVGQCQGKNCPKLVTGFGQQDSNSAAEPKR